MATRSKEGYCIGCLKHLFHENSDEELCAVCSIDAIKYLDAIHIVTIGQVGIIFANNLLKDKFAGVAIAAGAKQNENSRNNKDNKGIQISSASWVARKYSFSKQKELLEKLRSAD